MSDFAIKVNGLSKKFYIGHLQEKNQTFAEMITDAFSAPFRRAKKLLRGQATGAAELDQVLWALNDVSFEIKPGEVVGIIGRNGSGKSTLLKILSRITEPTMGMAKIHGRLGSLLEVGTGFHPELTGRENTYLNGAILGMRKKEIDRKFDEIVDFAEVEKFIDTPVKHYSTGMGVRLGFSVAAHLDPEILIIDEVLAVGDGAFQRKCVGKLQKLATAGNTVLMVSHNMATLQALCTRGILLQGGNVIADDTCNAVISTYLQTLEERATQNLAERTDRAGIGEVRLVDVQFYSHEGIQSDTLAVGRSAQIEFQLSEVIPKIQCWYTVYDSQGRPIVHFNTNNPCPEDQEVDSIGSKIICEISELSLLPGRYGLNVVIASRHGIQDQVMRAAIFDVEPGVLNGRRLDRDLGYGSIAMSHRWILPTVA